MLIIAKKRLVSIYKTQYAAGFIPVQNTIKIAHVPQKHHLNISFAHEKNMIENICTTRAAGVA
jgi:hypothetical protein